MRKRLSGWRRCGCYVGWREIQEQRARDTVAIKKQRDRLHVHATKERGRREAMAHKGSSGASS